MEFNLTGTDAPLWKTVYKLLIGAVVPRPIAWVSSIDAQGQRNLAPFSFFTVASANPPHLMFTTLTRGTDAGLKDTLSNIRATEEFVINVVTEQLAEAMNVTSAELPPHVDEFSLADLDYTPSVMVAPPRVAASPVSFECKLTHMLPLGEERELGTGTVIIGRVMLIHIADEVLYDGDKIEITRLKPIGRLAGTAYTRVTDLFDMHRPPSQINPQEEYPE